MTDVGPRDGQRGFSLIELIIATFLILVIAIGIIPLLMRSIQNNVRGGDSSELIGHLRSGHESMSFAALNDLALGDQVPTQNDPQFLDIPSTMLYTGPLDPLGGGDQTIGDEAWVPEAGVGVGLPIWERQTRIWYHPVSDVLPGIVTVGAGTSGATFETVGHPQLFDDPITVAQANAEPGNFVRIEMSVRSGVADDADDQKGTALGATQTMTLSRVRIY